MLQKISLTHRTQFCARSDQCGIKLVTYTTLNKSAKQRLSMSSSSNSATKQNPRSGSKRKRVSSARRENLRLSSFCRTVSSKNRLKLQDNVKPKQINSTCCTATCSKSIRSSSRSTQVSQPQKRNPTS